MGTRRQWAKDFSTALGNSNPSASLLAWISAWLAKENTKARFNPLATTYKLEPYTDFNSVGVKNYQSRAQGLEATVRTLRGDHTGYNMIIEGIVKNDPQTAANGLKAAPWGTNGSAVELLWKTADVGDSLLLSEPESVQAQLPNHVPERIPHTPVNPMGPEGENYNSGEKLELSAEMRTAYVLGGSLMMLIAGVLAFKTYVPVTQVVKTVASIAA